jgi:hypothetical protein
MAFSFELQELYPWIARAGLLSNGAGLPRNAADGLFTGPSRIILALYTFRLRVLK